jgi:inosine-uridine nucleoside N-ribohydrolase
MVQETAGAVGFLVHDASTVAALFYPETLRFRRAQLCVVPPEEDGRAAGHQLGGFTFVDNRHAAKTAANCWIGCSIDASACLSIMVQVRTPPKSR